MKVVELAKSNSSLSLLILGVLSLLALLFIPFDFEAPTKPKGALAEILGRLGKSFESLNPKYLIELSRACDKLDNELLSYLGISLSDVLSHRIPRSLASLGYEPLLEEAAILCYKFKSKRLRSLLSLPKARGAYWRLCDIVEYLGPMLYKSKGEFCGGAS